MRPARASKEGDMIDLFQTNGSSPPVHFHLENHGTIFPLRPISDSAQAWVDEHLPEDATWFCGAVVVEHCYIGAIVEGAIADGMVVR
jgi:hypothetical protein